MGKTSLLRRTFPDAAYVSFDNILNVASAREAPRSFLERFSGPTILDEIQYVPELFPAIKERIDAERDTMGCWLLSGSQRFELMSKVSESLAGRIAIIHLETLSAAELRSHPLIGAEGVRDILRMGGYPELWKSRELDRYSWFEDYIRTYVERDLSALINVKHLVEFRRFLSLLAARAGELINLSDMGRSCGVSNNTVKSWMAALEVSGIIYLLPPYHANVEKRLVKTPKLFFADTGLLSSLLGIGSADDMSAGSHAGHLWENFVLTELIKNGDGNPGRNLFFYRDHSGAEIDFVIEDPKGLVLIEAKYSERIRKERLSFGALEGTADGRILRNWVAAPTGQELPLPFGDYSVYDPRYCGLHLRQ